MKAAFSAHPKAVIIGVFLLGASAWYIPVHLAGVLAVLLLGAALCLGAYKRPFRRLLMAYAAFTVLWAAGRVGFGLYNHEGPGALSAGLLLGLDLVLRLFMIAGAGAGLLLLLTPGCIAKEAGLIVKRIAPNGFWKLSLAILIMLSYFEAALFAWRGISQILKLRGGSLPLHRKISIAGTALLRLLARQTWERTFAIAGRKLDSPGAWVDD